MLRKDLMNKISLTNHICLCYTQQTTSNKDEEIGNPNKFASIDGIFYFLVLLTGFLLSVSQANLVR